MRNIEGMHAVCSRYNIDRAKTDRIVNIASNQMNDICSTWPIDKKKCINSNGNQFSFSVFFRRKSIDRNAKIHFKVFVELMILFKDLSYHDVKKMKEKHMNKSIWEACNAFLPRNSTWNQSEFKMLIGFLSSLLISLQWKIRWI